MNKLTPYKILWLIIPVVVLLSKLMGLGFAYDIKLDDSYFVIALFHLAILSSIYLGLMGADILLLAKS